jgi:hypothetical protein
VAGVALAVRHWLLPYGSLNRDESSYVELAAMLRAGRLTLDPVVHAGLQPWASGVVDGRIVLKYSPVWPAVLAVADALGSRAAAAAAAGGLLVVLVHALATRVGDGRGARAAAVFVAASPFVLVQAATDLSYVFQLALGLAAALLVLTGRRRTTLVAGGVLVGVAFVARPFDALLLLVPFVAVAGRRRLLPAAAGAVPPLVAGAAYQWAVLGSPFRLPFTVTGPSDTFGFGRRGVFPEATVAFDLQDGVTALLRNQGWLVAWAFGGPILVGLAVHGFRRLRAERDGARGPVERALILIAVLYPLGYVGFWAAHATVAHWPGAASLGPYYHLPVLVSLAVFAGHGYAALPRRAAVRGAVLAAAVACTVTWLPPKLAVNREATRTYAAADDAVQGLTPPAVLLAPDRGRSGFVSWTPFLHNRPDLDQPVLFADDAGPANLALLDRHPDRRDRVARLVPTPSAIEPDGFRLEPLALTTLDAAAVRVRLAAASTNAATAAFLVDETGEHRRPLDGAEWRPALRGAEGQLAVGIEDPEGRVEVRIPWRRRGSEVELLLPGAGYVLREGAWAAGDASAALRVDVDQGV